VPVPFLTGVPGLIASSPPGATLPDSSERKPSGIPSTAVCARTVSVSSSLPSQLNLGGSPLLRAKSALTPGTPSVGLSLAAVSLEGRFGPHRTGSGLAGLRRAESNRACPASSPALTMLHLKSSLSSTFLSRCTIQQDRWRVMRAQNRDSGSYADPPNHCWAYNSKALTIGDHKKLRSRSSDPNAVRQSRRSRHEVPPITRCGDLTTREI
jgi:hypothetical protein